MSKHTLWTDAQARLEAAKRRGVHTSDALRIGEAIATAAATYEGAADALEALKADQYRSAAAKREKADQVTAAAERNAAERIEAARAVYASAVKYHEDRATYPASEGTPADREARLANARADLHRLIGKVESGKVADRLRFAVTNGSEAMRELILRERYPERVLFPAAGKDGAADAAMWAELRPRALAEALEATGKPERAAAARASTAALAAIRSDVAAAVTIAEHAAHLDATSLRGSAEAFGPPPTVPVAPAPAAA